MAIFKNSNKSSSLTRPAFFLPKSLSSAKKYTSLDEDESSCVSTTPRNKQPHHEVAPITRSDASPRVKFNTKASVREIVRIKDLAKDTNDLWFNASDYKRMRQKALSIVRAVDKGSHQVEGKRLCARGLERYLASSKATADTLRNEAWSSVFEEQSMQLATGEKYNDDRLSSIYLEFSMAAQIEAHERGLSDAREAGKYMLKKSGGR
eukprot:CAMPEP_0117021392 /NCGR_PEP_ID=MMETSP0472-20121206/16138_1 /TAXON_ID=693140 ORGANISM="Tiarina fusus, Strain LIS" /NCGR_SAMPLE_ID=MMETSP0472 /ASSEMBLY_ACC=CAM_ASM_000603 /LENGTH=206 /DNA_ID=CAMNT_0004726847 /DNA_START=23 /DNA_END=643 /DNA_ORIENTATION=+